MEVYEVKKKEREICENYHYIIPYITKSEVKPAGAYGSDIIYGL